ncbi:MAG: HAD family hydrolase [Pseudomonadota bacterium]|nr:HAD family hydrolase [Pseudomonadota bacterium]
MYGFEALIFDVDGTLADTERDGHRPAFNAAFAEVGLDWDWSVDVYGELLAVTGGKERIRYFIERWRPASVPSEDLDGFIADLHRRKTRHYVDMLRGGAIPLRPGVLRLLRQARDAGIRLAIATTTTPENVSTLLECSGEPELPSWFEVIAAGDIVPAKKPAPDIFLLALEKLVLPPRSCIAVEDSDNGVRSALGAGLDALLVTVSSYTRAQDFSGAALVVDQLGDPGMPIHALQGSLGGADRVDLAVLDAMHRRVYSGS